MRESENTIVELKKIHLAVAIVVALAAPIISGMSSYYKAMNDLAPRSDVDKLQDKIDRIAEDVAEIKGYLKPHR